MSAQPAFSPAVKAPSVLVAADIRLVVDDCTPKRWTKPNDAQLRGLLHFLNLCRAPEPTSPEPRSQRWEAILKSIHTLTADLPNLLAINAREREKAAQDDAYLTFYSPAVMDAFQRLYDAAYELQNRRFPVRPPRKRWEAWHGQARTIATLAPGIWHPATVGAGTTLTAPVVKLVCALLPLIGGGDRTPAAVAKELAAMRRDAKRQSSTKPAA